MSIFYKRNRVDEDWCVRKLPKVVALLLQCIIVIAGATFSGSYSLQAQCIMVCNSSVEISLFDRSDFTVTPGIVMQDPYQNCPGGQFIVRIYSNNTSIGNKVNYSHIGQLLTYEVSNVANGNYCNGRLRVVDNLPPEIEIENTFVSCSEAIEPAITGHPVITDNISPADSLLISYHDVHFSTDCAATAGDSLISGRVERIWQAVDERGNVATKTQLIYFVRRQLGDIQFPKNRDGVSLPALQCQRDNPQNLSLTGVPTIEGYSIFDSNNCDLAISYTDRLTQYCDGDQRILRTWTAIDWCADSTVNVIQVIRIRDFQAPALFSPDTLKFTTNPNSCTATIQLPAGSATDSCSTPDITIRWQFGSGQGPFYNVPVGEYEVTYTATDKCGNATTDKAIVIVQENQPPQAICDQVKDIQLQPAGNAFAFAETFNDGSHDNCGIALFEVRRNNQAFSDRVFFTCQDIDRQVQVEMRVTDIYGFTNSCYTSVTVLDQVAPALSCPPDITLLCGTDFRDLTITGESTTMDNCSSVNLSHADEVQLNACGTGTIRRTFLALDAQGNKSSCLQTITLEDNTPVQVDFPGDFLTYSCDADISPAQTGSPQISGADCEQPEVTFVDQEFSSHTKPACFKIWRKWTVIDWCTYDRNSDPPQGIWEHTQFIEIKDTTAPTLEVPAVIAIGTKNDKCEGVLNMQPVVATDCSPQLTITNDAPYAINNNSGDASGTYPVGTHTIRFTVTDGCGNSTVKSTQIIVRDDKAPTPVCGNGVTLSLNSDGTTHVTPAVLSPGSFDNCSPAAALELSVAPQTFTCEDVGEKTVTITAIDEAGNRGFCTTTVVIQDNLNACGTGDHKADIRGAIATMGGQPAVQVPMGLSGGVPMARQTDIDGSYAFENLPKGENYTITPVYDADPAAGVSTFDLVLIQKHILNVTPFHSPYQWVAADANRSGTVSTLDMVILRKLILRVTTALPNNTSWRFVPSNYAFPQDNPLSAPFPERIQIQNLQSNQLNKNFVAIKTGDVNGSARLNAFGDDVVDNRQHDNLVLTSQDIHMEAGQTYQIEIQARDFKNILGLQFSLLLDQSALQLLDIERGTLPGFDDRNVGRTLYNEEGILTFSWNGSRSEAELAVGETLFSLHVRAIQDIQLSEGMRLATRPTLAEAYRQTSVTDNIHDTKIHGIELGFIPQSFAGIKTGPNYPNPFDRQTTLPVEMSQGEDVQLSIYNLSGQLLYRASRHLPQGSHKWRISASDLKNQTGVFYYRISVGNARLTNGKIIRLER